MELTRWVLPTPGKNVRAGDVRKETSVQGFMEDGESATFLRCVDQFGDWIVTDCATQGRHLSSRDQLLLTIERINEHVQDGDRQYTFHMPVEVHGRRQIQEIYQYVEDEMLPDVAKRIKAENYKQSERTKMEEDIAKEKEAVEASLEQKKIAWKSAWEKAWRSARECAGKRARKRARKSGHPSKTRLVEKTWLEIDRKVEQWFKTLDEMRKRQLEGNLDDNDKECLRRKLNTAGAIALGLAGGVAIVSPPAAAPVVAATSLAGMHGA